MLLRLSDSAGKSGAVYTFKLRESGLGFFAGEFKVPVFCAKKTISKKLFIYFGCMSLCSELARSPNQLRRCETGEKWFCSL
jgi:hypothetical protein